MQNKTIDNKKIIGIIGIVFVALVGYKFISSSIQENKEESVLEHKYNLEQLSKKPLQDCLDNIEKKLDFDIDWANGYLYPAYTSKNNILCKESKEFCFSLTEVNDHIADLKKEAEQNEILCYQRYK